MAQKVEAQTGYVDVELSRPLKIDGTEVTKLRVREPTVEDQITVQEMKASEAVKDITMMANLCEISPADIKKLTLRDYKKVQEAFLGFTE
jgi:formylmethanofuran dehydrogenase subunit D